ncbi:MAG TPA: universal stress protein [candidate division Zixibacteria bacterium]|nr:universal stress protein [candidate division Zixibacteria bacterium]
MQVYRNILVAMDCSEVDDFIVDHVSKLARQNKAKVFLIHVVHSHTLDQDRALREQAEAALSVHLKRLRDEGIEVEAIVRSGEPDEQILKEIDEHDYDLVAMATHGHSFVGKLLFGSVSRTLKHKINVPLLIVRPSR